MHTWLLSKFSPANVNILYMSICTIFSCFLTVFLAVFFHWAASGPESYTDMVTFILSVAPSFRFGFRWGWCFHTAFSWTFVVFVAFTNPSETNALRNMKRANAAWITACFVGGCAWMLGTRMIIFRERRAACACSAPISTDRSGRQIRTATATLHQPLVANADRRSARPSKRS